MTAGSGLTPFEEGVVVALNVLVASLKKSGALDAQLLETKARFFMANPSVSGEAAISAFEWPLSALLSKPEGLD